MICSDQSIISLRQEGKIVIDPFNPEHLGPNSYDVTLGTRIIQIAQRDARYPIDRDDPSTFQVNEIEMGPQGITVSPNLLLLGSTVESFGTPPDSDYVAMLEGRSSYARLGLSIHTSAGFGDIGFIGSWTLEFTSVLPVLIKPGVRIAQAFFIRATSLPNNAYKNSKGYSGKSFPVPPKSDLKP